MKIWNAQEIQTLQKRGSKQPHCIKELKVNWNEVKSTLKTIQLRLNKNKNKIKNLLLLCFINKKEREREINRKRKK